MTQTSFAVITKIQENQIDELRSRLIDIKTEQHPKFLDFRALPQVHFASFVICEDPLPEKRFDPFLVFENNIDGTSEEYLKDLCDHAAASLRYVYQCCRSYPSAADPSTDALFRYFKAIQPDAFLMGNVGGTVATILREHELHVRLQRFLGERRSCTEPEHIKAEIEELVDRERLLEGMSDKPTNAVLHAIRKNKMRPLDAVFSPVGRGRTAWFGVLIIILVGLRYPVVWIVPFIVAGLIGIWLILLRLATRWEEPLRVDPERTKRLAKDEAENTSVHNHLVVTAIVKPDLPHLLTLKLVLWLARLLTKWGAGKEDIGIHFAQWTLIKDKDKKCHVLLFLSNYDGGWTHYLDLFIDRAHTGVNAIWGNAVHFPKTRLLLFRGARDGARLKAAIRAYQHSATVKYCAYPNLPILNIFNNSMIRSQIGKKLWHYELIEWVSRF